MTDRLHVIVVPGADGLAFTADAAQAARRGAALHSLTLPVFTGHPIDAQAAFYADVAALIRAKVADLRATGAPVFAIGRNFGGSLLGHAAARGAELDGIVLIGAIPSLSEFRMHGEHPSAKRFRAALGGDTTRIGLLEPLDLTASLQAIDPRRCLLQIGRGDPYMDERSVNIIQNLKAKFNVEWHDDDHAMAGPETVSRRWGFIAGLGRRSPSRPPCRNRVPH